MNSRYDYIKGIEEKQFVKTIIDYVHRADQQNRMFLTDFYNKDWMESLLDRYVPKKAYINYTFFGGYEGAERQRLAISPYEMSNEAFEIGVLRIEVKTGLGKDLSHRDYLGAILALGIERNIIGDIILTEWGAYIILSESMIPYLRSQLISIGRYQKIVIEQINLSEIQVEKPKTKQVKATVSALRIDAVGAVMFGLSRSECARLIQGDKARRNGLIVTTSDLIEEGDTLTLRGYGKAKLVAIDGYTKKDRLHITIEKYI